MSRSVLTVALLPAFLVLCGDSLRGAVTVETFESFANGEVLTTQIPGLTISAPGGSPEIQIATTPVVPGQPKGLAHIPYLDPPDYLVIDFSPGASQAGAIIDFGDVGLGVKITAFDGVGATGSILGTQSTTTETFIGVISPGIRSVRFETIVGGAQTPTYLIDNLTYELVPEPSTLGLAALSLFGLVFAARKRPAWECD